MLKDQRLKFLLEQLHREHSISIASLNQTLNVSYMTLWRDLEELEQQGLLKRVRGGAVPAPVESPLELPAFPNFDPQTDTRHYQKARIGRYAAEHLIQDGDSLTIEAGTTASAIVPALQHKNLTILTNGLVTSLLAARFLPDNSVLCSGGVLLDNGAFIGPMAEAFFSNFRVKKVFFGACGVTPQDGFTDPSPLYSHLKKVMYANAEQCILLLDSSKLGVRSLVHVMPLLAAKILVTDSEADPAVVAELRAFGLDVRIAE